MTQHDPSRPGAALAPAKRRDERETQPRPRAPHLPREALPELGASPLSAFRPIVAMAAALAVWRGLSVSVRRTLAAAAVDALGRANARIDHPPLERDRAELRAQPDAR